MSSTFENTVFDFDLDFLNQPATSNVEDDQQARAAKLRRQVCKIKKKVKWVDENVESIILANKIVDEFRVREIQLQAQCKQQLVEIGTFIEKITGLENEICAAETRERQKNEKISELENQVAALKVLQIQIKALQFEKNNAKNELVETRRKDKTKISNFNKENEKLRKENAKIPSLEKEIERLRKENTLVAKEKSIENNETARIQKLEKEIEILCEENTKISKLEKEIETLNKKNTESLNLEKEIEILRKENTKISKLEKEIDKKNAESLKLEKEIENLQKENSKIPKMAKEIEHLRKENANIIKCGSENENLFKQNVNLKTDIETLRIKNAKIEMENKAFIKEIDTIRNEKKDIETQLTHLTSTTKEKGKLLQKKNKLTRKYKSLPDRNGDWCDHSKDKNYLFEDPMLPPSPHDTIIAMKSPIVDKDIAMLREPDNDNSNEVASEDTGRGSSLANSDTEKSLHSPEYFLNYSHPTEENIKNKTKAKEASMLRGSIMLEDIDDATITTVEHDKIQNVCEPQSVSQTNAASEVSINVDTFDNTINCTQGEQEKQCLEMNNSLQCDSHTNQELLHIFSTMRLHCKAMSPIPRTPIKMHEVDSTFSSSDLDEKITRCSLLCKETAVFLIQLEMRLGSRNHRYTINNCDRLIACLDSVLKSEQTLNEDPIPNTNPNMEISDCVFSHDDNSLVSIPESTTSLSEKVPELLQNKKRESRLSQNRMLREVNNSVIISNQSSPETETNIFTHQQAENGLSMDRNQIFNHPVSQELAMNNEISEITASVRCDDQSPIVNSVGKKSKNKKNTKLGKLKKKLEPKYKIRTEKTPPRNLRIKPKQLIEIKKNVTINGTSASLNNKDAYEKAVKVMAELNSQQGTKTKTPTQTEVLMSPKRTTCLEVNETSASLNNKDNYEKAVKVMGELNCQQGAKTKLPAKQTKVLMSPKRTSCLGVNGTSASLKNKDAYEKAVKVMAELNSQQDAKTKSPPNKTTVLKSRSRTNSLQKVTNDSSENQFLRKCSMTRRSKRNLSDLFDTCSVVMIKDPLLLSPLKSQNSTTHEAEEDNNSTTHRVLEDNNVTILRAKEDEKFTTQRVKDRVDEESDSTTDRAKQDSNATTDRINENDDSTINRAKENSFSTIDRVNEDIDFKTNRAKDDSNSTTDRVNDENDSTTNRANEGSNSTTDTLNEDNDSTTNRAKEDCDHTENRAKENQDNESSKEAYKAGNSSMNRKGEEDTSYTNHNATEDSETCDELPSRKRRRRSSNEPLIQSKKDQCFTTYNATEDSKTCDELPPRKGRRRSSNEPLIQSKKDKCFTTHNATEDSETCDELPTRKGRRRSSNEPLIQSKKDKCFTTHNAIEDSETCDELPPRKGRRRSSNEPLIQSKKDKCFTTHNAIEDSETCDELPPRKGRRRSSNEPLIQSKKDKCFTTHNAIEDSETCDELPPRKGRRRSSNEPLIQSKKDKCFTTHNAIEDSETCDELPPRKGRRRSSNEPLIQSKKDKCFTTHNAIEDSETCDELPPRKGRRRSSNEPLIQSKKDNCLTTHNAIEDSETCDELPSRKRRRRSNNEPLIQPKRVLRSATMNNVLCMEDKMELSNTNDKSKRKSRIVPVANGNDTQLIDVNTHESLQFNRRDNNVGGFYIVSEDIQLEKKTSAPVRELNTEASVCHPKESILCYMLEKHGVDKVKAHHKKIPENTVKQICEKIEQDITIITEAKDNKNAMNNFVDDLRKLDHKHFIAGLIMFLAKPERKAELFGKVNSHPAPPMTKTEQVLLYAINQLETHWPSVDIVDGVLSSIEFALFKLNRTPEFGVIESTSHFYAILCRYVKAKSRLRLFMLDAMYCIQFKSVPLIKQCLEVWMHTIPLSHMGMAKTPLVTCLVYLLHFYKCEDKYNRVNEIRKILRDKYYYSITDWNEAKILEMIKNSIKDLKDICIEKKMLRLALVILGKRQGPQWCQNNIVKKLLQPMIEKNNVPNHVKEFCVSMIGPLMKPYPVDMKVHCEIAINQLVDILNKNPSPKMEEAAMTSMMYINRHDQRSINKTLLTRKMKPMSLALEKSIRDYVKTRPLKIWKKNLTKIA